MNSILQEKTTLRIACKEKMNSFSSSFVSESEKQFAHLLLHSPLVAQAQTLFCYVSTQNEAGTHLFISELLAQKKNVCVPKCLPNRKLAAVPISSLQELSEGFWGLPEPPSAELSISSSQLDLIIVPCLSCDLSGTRLGYGGGYYDRYLSQTNATTLCLCYEELLQSRLPTDPYDIPMSFIVTQKKIFCSNSNKF